MHSCRIRDLGNFIIHCMKQFLALSRIHRRFRGSVLQGTKQSCFASNDWQEELNSCVSWELQTSSLCTYYNILFYQTINMFFSY